jgi:hypothetical protein
VESLSATQEHIEADEEAILLPATKHDFRRTRFLERAPQNATLGMDYSLVSLRASPMLDRDSVADARFVEEAIAFAVGTPRGLCWRVKRSSSSFVVNDNLRMVLMNMCVRGRTSQALT